MEMDDGGFNHRDRTARPSAPSAPPGETNVMVADPQQIAPPTYEESRYDPVAPANYWQDLSVGTKWILRSVLQSVSVHAFVTSFF